MSLYTNIIDSVSGYIAGVDVNKNLLVNLPTTKGQEGYVRIADKWGHEIEVDDDGRISMDVNNLLFNDPVDGAAVDIRKWSASNLTMTQAQASGFITLNSGSSLAINLYSIITGVVNFDIMHESYVYFHSQVLTPNIPQINATMEFGLGTVATTAAPTDGAFFRWTTAGDFRCVINNAGTEVQSAALTAPTQNVVHHYEIKIQHGEADFFIDGVEVATLVPGSGTANITNSARIPTFYRVYTAGTSPAAAPVLKIAAVDVWRTVLNMNLPWNETRVKMGNGSYQFPISAFAQTANHANSTSPTSATLSNTAAGYTTLGGRWQFAAPAGAATDFALFGAQVPAGYQLHITNFNMSSVNTGATVATTPTIIDWGVGLNSSAVSLATTDTATTWAPRRIPLGIQGWIVGALAGASSGNQDINLNLRTPWVVDSARFFHVIIQVFIGTATASQVIRGDVFIGGYFD